MTIFHRRLTRDDAFRAHTPISTLSTALSVALEGGDEATVGRAALLLTGRDAMTYHTPQCVVPWDISARAAETGPDVYARMDIGHRVDACERMGLAVDDARAMAITTAMAGLGIRAAYMVAQIETAISATGTTRYAGTSWLARFIASVA